MVAGNFVPGRRTAGSRASAASLRLRDKPDDEAAGAPKLHVVAVHELVCGFKAALSSAQSSWMALMKMADNANHVNPIIGHGFYAAWAPHNQA
jgi:hypothetical protein